MARKKAKQKQRGLDVDDAYYYVKEKEKKEDTKDEKQKKQKEKMENDSELTKKAFKVRKSEVREKSRKKQRGLVDYGSQQKEKKKKDTKEKKKKKERRRITIPHCQRRHSRFCWSGWGRGFVLGTPESERHARTRQA